MAILGVGGRHPPEEDPDTGSCFPVEIAAYGAAGGPEARAFGRSTENDPGGTAVGGGGRPGDFIRVVQNGFGQHGSGNRAGERCGLGCACAHENLHRFGRAEGNGAEVIRMPGGRVAIRTSAWRLTR